MFASAMETRWRLRRAHGQGRLQRKFIFGRLLIFLHAGYALRTGYLAASLPSPPSIAVQCLARGTARLRRRNVSLQEPESPTGMTGMESQRCRSRNSVLSTSGRAPAANKVDHETGVPATCTRLLFAAKLTTPTFLSAARRCPVSTFASLRLWTRLPSLRSLLPSPCFS